MRDAVAAAVMAPSSHNTQPWRFRISGATLDMFADPGRRLRIIDPERRQQMQSCGCALYNARVAVRAMGFTDEVTVMLVDSDEPHHIASLHLGEVRIPDALDHMRIEAIAVRHTNRRAFAPSPVPPEDVDALIAEAACEGATLVRLDPAQKAELAELVVMADHRQLANPGYRLELERWITRRGSLRHDGIPGVEKERTGDHAAQIYGAPIVAVIGTPGDEPNDWLASGQALEAVLLRATALGLSASFLDQVLEVPDLRARVGALVPDIGYPQMILRIGLSLDPIRHPAPRRSLGDVID